MLLQADVVEARDVTRVCRFGNSTFIKASYKCERFFLLARTRSDNAVHWGERPRQKTSQCEGFDEKRGKTARTFRRVDISLGFRGGGG